jgi:hypothetical protein
MVFVGRHRQRPLTNTRYRILSSPIPAHAVKFSSVEQMWCGCQVPAHQIAGPTPGINGLKIEHTCVWIRCRKPACTESGQLLEKFRQCEVKATSCLFRWDVTWVDSESYTMSLWHDTTSNYGRDDCCTELGPPRKSERATRNSRTHSLLHERSESIRLRS